MRRTAFAVDQCARFSPIARKLPSLSISIKVAGNSGSAGPHKWSFVRFAIQSSKIARMSSPTGMKYVTKLLLNLVSTSRASRFTSAFARSMCFSLRETKLCHGSQS